MAGGLPAIVLIVFVNLHLCVWSPLNWQCLSISQATWLVWRMSERSSQHLGRYFSRGRFCISNKSKLQMYLDLIFSFLSMNGTWSAPTQEMTKLASCTTPSSVVTFQTCNPSKSLPLFRANFVPYQELVHHQVAQRKLISKQRTESIWSHWIWPNKKICC